MVRRVDEQGEVLIWLVQEMLGLCATEDGTKIDELSKRPNILKIQGQKNNHEKRVSEAFE